MVTLEIDLNCMCLFVPQQGAEPGKGSVHVLMPCTHHGTGHARHMAALLFTDTAGERQLRRLEGWELVLGQLPGTARTELKPVDATAQKGVIVDLTDVNGLRVSETLVTGNDHSVVSRITFRHGEVVAVDAQDAEWEIKGNKYTMAHQVTWRMQLPSETLQWNDLRDRPGNPEKPLPSLSEVVSEGAGDDKVFRLHVHHVTEKVFKNDDGTNTTRPRPDVEFDPRVLTPLEIQEHFRMFYELLGDPDPDKRLLPEFVVPPKNVVVVDEEPAPEPEPAVEPESGDEPETAPDAVVDPPGGGGGWACKTAQAQM